MVTQAKDNGKQQTDILEESPCLVDSDAGPAMGAHTNRFSGDTEREQYLSVSSEVLDHAFSDRQKAAAARIEKLFGMEAVAAACEEIGINAAYRLRRLRELASSNPKNTPSVRLRALEEINEIILEAKGLQKVRRRYGREDPNAKIDKTVGRDVRQEAEAADKVWGETDEPGSKAEA